MSRIGIGGDWIRNQSLDRGSVGEQSNVNEQNTETTSSKFYLTFCGVEIMIVAIVKSFQN